MNFEYTDYGGGYRPVQMTYKYVLDGKTVNTTNSPNETHEFADLAVELHGLMAKHTGGDWVEFAIVLDRDGKAATKFKYPEGQR